MSAHSHECLLFSTQGASSASDFSCAPNETFKNDCNTCVCSADGKTALCDQRACLPEASESSTEAQLSSTADVHIESSNHVCTPDDVKMQVGGRALLIGTENSFVKLLKDCNRCRCAANGIGWFCTKLACPKPIQKRAVMECTPGTRWHDGCNNCFCTGKTIVAKSFLAIELIGFSI